MTELSKAEEQLLVAVLSMQLRKEPVDVPALEEFGKRFFDDDLVEWSDAFDSLTANGHLKLNDGLYSLSEDAARQAAKFRKKHMSSGFDEWLVRSSQSKTYSHFCKLVYGLDLCQCSLVDMPQLETLQLSLGLTPKSRVLDLGCGIGMITEYLSDRTGANILGVDFAENTIDEANKRTAQKRDRLFFLVCDMNDLQFHPNSFDTIIAIDTLYFVDHLDQTVKAMRRIAGDTGQMGLFYTQMIKPDDSKDILLPDSTKLAVVLRNCSLSYAASCFTENEHEIWRREKSVAEQLRSDFENEGYMDLCESRIKEAEHLLEIFDSGRASRYFYHITDLTK